MEALREKIKSVQDAERFEHTLSVAYTAACLAGVYHVDVYKALRAGMLHDCAKCIPDNVLMTMALEYHIPCNDTEKKIPFLLHAKVGAELAKVQYSEIDEDVLNAIRYHTTGRPGMSMLEKIVFVADYMEPLRNKAADLDMIRKLAFTDIDAAIVKILLGTLSYLKKKGGEVDSSTEKTLQYYLNVCSKI